MTIANEDKTITGENVFSDDEADLQRRLDNLAGDYAQER